MRCLFCGLDKGVRMTNGLDTVCVSNTHSLLWWFCGSFGVYAPSEQARWANFMNNYCWRTLLILCADFSTFFFVFSWQKQIYLRALREMNTKRQTYKFGTRFNIIGSFFSKKSFFSFHFIRVVNSHFICILFRSLNPI